MPDENMTLAEMDEILKKARSVYGDRNQILVCIEELNELCCVLAKYPRYENAEEASEELFEKALDEVADVYTILEHVKAIFHMTEGDVLERRFRKVTRLKRWLTHSDSISETVYDRTVEGDVCKDCMIIRNEENYDNYCVSCLKAQATEGIAPYKITKE